MRHRKMTILVATAGLLATACGGGDDSTESASGAGEILVVADDDGTGPGNDDGTGPGNDPGNESGELLVDDAAPVDSVADPVDPDATQTDEEQALAFAQCMRDEGIDFPDPVTAADGSIDFSGSRGPAGNGEATRAAFQVCGDQLDGASFLPGGGDRFDEETQDTFLEFAQCLRDQGLDVDDPDLSDGFPAPGDGGGRGGVFGDGFDPQDPANADAIETCQGIFTEVFGR